MTTKPVAWTPFWWESNACWGAVETPEAWETMVAAYKARKPTVSVRAAREEMIRVGATATWDHPTSLIEAGSLLSIGMRREHIGGQPFKDWLIENGMYETAMGPPPTMTEKLTNWLKSL